MWCARSTGNFARERSSWFLKLRRPIPLLQQVCDEGHVEHAGRKSRDALCRLRHSAGQSGLPVPMLRMRRTAGGDLSGLGCGQSRISAAVEETMAGAANLDGGRRCERSLALSRVIAARGATEYCD